MNNLNKVVKFSGPTAPLITAAKILAGVATVGYFAYNSLYSVPSGHRGVVFSRLSGVKNVAYDEGTHFRIPGLEKYYLYNVRTRPTSARSRTGTRDLQMVDITLRVLYRPNKDALPHIHSRMGMDYDERVLPSLTQETVKSVIAQFNASQLITQREQVSNRIKQYLIERSRDFHIEIDDVSIPHLTFGKEYTAAVEDKQVAQQQAERAKYIVDRATQDKKSTIIKAQGDAKSAELIGQALAENPAYVELRRLDAAKDIANVVSQGGNKMYLQSDTLLLNLLNNTGSDSRMEKKQ